MTRYRYIELNPVRANMVSHPDEYPWPSYRHTATGKPDELITTHETYRSLGNNNSDRQKLYIDLFMQDIDELELEGIRVATNQERVLGSANYKKQIEQKLNRQSSSRPRAATANPPPTDSATRSIDSDPLDLTSNPAKAVIFIHKARFTGGPAIYRPGHLAIRQELKLKN